MYQVENINGTWHVTEKHEKGFYNFKRPCQSEDEAIALCNRANGCDDKCKAESPKAATKLDLFLETLKPIQRTRTKLALEKSTNRGLVWQHIEKVASNIKEIISISKSHEVRYIGIDGGEYISKCFYKSGIDFLKWILEGGKNA